MKTKFAKNTDVDRKWHVVNADGLVLGRLASRVAAVLKGKDKAIYTPHVDTGDFVVIINADKIRLTGNKIDQKEYYRHTGYPGGLRVKKVKDLIQDAPEEIISTAIRGMMPKSRLGRQQFKKLKVYRGSDHPHQAQNPEPLNLTK
ncbi:MAG: 50S ribosomal protein L13 [Nitrospiraceae bacterium]|nr:MAG: 50S ribosomal protein L13 [Nitrospiraceae bacterium]